MAVILATGEALTGEGNELAHIDLLIGSKSGPVGAAFASAFTNEKEGHTNLLAVVTPNLPAKPDTVISNKVTIKGEKQAVQLFGQRRPRSPARSSIPCPRVSSRRTRSMICASSSACSSTGRQPTTKRSTTTTTRR